MLVVATKKLWVTFAVLAAFVLGYALIRYAIDANAACMGSVSRAYRGEFSYRDAIPVCRLDRVELSNDLRAFDDQIKDFHLMTDFGKVTAVYSVMMAQEHNASNGNAWAVGFLRAMSTEADPNVRAASIANMALIDDLQGAIYGAYYMSKEDDGIREACLFAITEQQIAPMSVKLAQRDRIK